MISTSILVAGGWPDRAWRSTRLARTWLQGLLIAGRRESGRWIGCLIRGHLQMNADFLVVGAGLTGAVIAQALTDAGKRVLVLNRRSHRRQCSRSFSSEWYPNSHLRPALFSYDDDELWRFVNRFASFYKYEAALKSWVDGKYENWPIAASYIRRVIGEKWEPEFKGTAGQF